MLNDLKGQVRYMLSEAGVIGKFGVGVNDGKRLQDMCRYKRVHLKMYTLNINICINIQDIVEDINVKSLIGSYVFIQRNCLDE